MRDLPRTARLCLVVYGLSTKGAKGSRRTFKDVDNEMYINPVAWGNTTIYDYEGLLKTGSITLYMWNFNADVQTEEILNPLGNRPPVVSKSHCIICIFLQELSFQIQMLSMPLP